MDKINMKFLTLVFLLFCIVGNAQNLKIHNIFGIIPAHNTQINGLALGLPINTLTPRNDSTVETRVNGFCLELIGMGLILPMVGSDPIFTEKPEVYQNPILVDSILNLKTFENYKINGVVISGGGLAGHNIAVNGLNISILNTLTSKTNGLSAVAMFNMCKIMKGISISLIGNSSLKTKGVQIGLFNSSIVLKGLQIGLFNSTYQLKGVQFGLWNKNSKRKLPILNWSFK
jgi:hypothetical protein